MRDETIHSFARGLSAIYSFRYKPLQTITDVAAATGMPRAAARRILRTLCEQGLAVTDGKNYELTPAILDIGHAYLAGRAELDALHDTLVGLTQEIGESASAGVLDGTEIIYIARSPARHRILSYRIQVGTRFPAHATSIGQVLLANLSPNQLSSYLSKMPLEPFTQVTITTASQLKQRLNEVRQRGYALVNEELEAGLCTLAVAVESNYSRQPYAINISTRSRPASQQDAMIAKALPLLKSAASQLKQLCDGLAAGIPGSQ